MRNLKQYILYIAVLAATMLGTAAQAGVRVSLLTCSPGDDIYTKFGHTAIRATIDGEYDWVFNYGCFNYNSDNFVMKFVMGQTDYMLQAEPTRFFMERYRKSGVGVREQVLNLTDEEAETLVALLEDNLRPENQKYRYNWLRDNCTERARDMIEKAIGGMLDYERKEDEDITVREILHYCLKDTPWMDWGISLLLGCDIDMPANKRVQMFLPELFMVELGEANIIRLSTGRQNAVLEDIEVFQPVEQDEDGVVWLTPVAVFSVVLALVVLITVRDLRRKRLTAWVDVLLCTLQGLAGCLITFLFCCSEHPSVDTNWLVLVFNPIPLAYAAWIVYCQHKKKRNMLAVAYFTALAASLPTMALCMQYIYPATFIVIMILVVRAFAQMILCRREKGLLYG